MLSIATAPELDTAEAWAASIRARLRLGEPPYSPVFVACSLGYTITRVSWAELGTFGASRGRRIFVARTSYARDRWTIAHELAHLELGHAGPHTRDEERLADRCAAALLIPAHLVRPRLSRLDLVGLARTCGTSLEGTARRVLDITPGCVVVAERRRVRTSTSGLAAPPDRILRVAEELAPRALGAHAVLPVAVDGWVVRAWPSPSRSRAVAVALAENP